MRCLRNQAMLSAMRDGDTLHAHEVEDHEKHCAECTAFDAALDTIDAIAPPEPPDGMIDRILQAVEEEREDAAAVAAAAAAMAAVTPAEPVTHGDLASNVAELFKGPRMWRSLAVLTTVAASFVAVMLIGSLGSRTGAVADKATEETGTGGFSLSYGSRSEAPAADDVQSAPPATPAKAPDYVSFQERVYAPGALLADSSAASPTVGTITSAFGTAGAAMDATVYRSPLTDGSIVVQGPDGLRLYTPVVRMLDSTRYQLTTGIPIERFGAWPTLPARLSPPSAADGSPTFVAAVKDAAGVQVYAAAGQPVSTGFAIAPRTAVTDPAAGNPNWTWWAPLAR